MASQQKLYQFPEDILAKQMQEQMQGANWLDSQFGPHVVNYGGLMNSQPSFYATATGHHLSQQWDQNHATFEQMVVEEEEEEFLYKRCHFNCNSLSISSFCIFERLVEIINFLIDSQPSLLSSPI